MSCCPVKSTSRPSATASKHATPYSPIAVSWDRRMYALSICSQLSAACDSHVIQQPKKSERKGDDRNSEANNKEQAQSGQHQLSSQIEQIHAVNGTILYVELVKCLKITISLVSKIPT
jgi:hypothetical protein